MLIRLEQASFLDGPNEYPIFLFSVKDDTLSESKIIFYQDSANVHVEQSTFSELHNFEYLKRLETADSRFTQSICDHLELIEKINSFRDLKEEWAGEDTVLPSSTAIEDGLKFARLLPLDALSPQGSVASDGEINFYWRNKGKFIDVSFFGNGFIHYYIVFDRKLPIN